MAIFLSALTGSFNLQSAETGTFPQATTQTEFLQSRDMIMPISALTRGYILTSSNRKGGRSILP